ncbi:MAG: hypothetical protein CM15mP49_16620 [Actinomycetota bacterium]|nr:MAG: hypothetical protein CM15mP49_16620 [Actinomycetota bacterium]
MEAAGIRNGIRATADIQALGFHQSSSKEYMEKLSKRDLKESLSERTENLATTEKNKSNKVYEFVQFPKNFLFAC